MPAKVELHRDVAAFVRYWCSREEQDEFRGRLLAIGDKPISNSAPYADPDLSRYMLRCFRFGRGIEKIAIFAYEATESRIRVLECRLAMPRRRRNSPGADVGDGL